HVGVEATCAGELDHSLRLVEEGQRYPQLADEPLCQLTLAATDLEHTLRCCRSDRLECELPRIGARRRRIDGLARTEVLLGCVLLGDVLRRGQVPHAAFSATNTDVARRATNGSSISSGRLSTNGDIEIEARTYSSTSARSANTSSPSTSWRRTVAKC